MAWFNWFSSKKSAAHGNATSSRGPHSDVLTSQQLDYTRPMMGNRTGAQAQPAAQVSNQRLEQRRNERNAKRELLFQVVRESMVRVGVLSSAFKFKVLSLDQRGRSFLVMIELSAEFSGEVEKLAEIESMIAQTARHRYEVIVQAVYWRYFNVNPASANAATPSVSMPSPAASAPAPLLGALHAPISRPAPLFAMGGPASEASAAQPLPSSAAQVAAMRAAAAATQKTAAITGSFPIIGATAAQKAAATAPTPKPRTPAGQDDLSDEEVNAFRRALAAGAAQGAMASAMPATSSAAKPAAASAVSSTLDQARNKLLLTGYEDTEMADDDPMPALSGTQYGDLR